MLTIKLTNNINFEKKFLCDVCNSITFTDLSLYEIAFYRNHIVLEFDTLC